MSKIKRDFGCIKTFKRYLDINYRNMSIFATSGGFDPVHVGHLRCFDEMRQLSDRHGDSIVVVVINGDGFLNRKKGYAFMSEEERLEIISGFRSVDFAVIWNDESQTVCGALEIIQPDFFCKGGDRDSFENVPESKVCTDIGCEVLFNVGGEKVQSSSTLVDRMDNFAKGTIDI